MSPNNPDRPSFDPDEPDDETRPQDSSGGASDSDATSGSAPGGDAPKGPSPFGAGAAGFEQLLAAMGISAEGGELPDLNQVLAQVQASLAQYSQQMSMFTSGLGEDSMNWTFTKDVARKVTASLGDDPTPLASQQRAVADAVQLANLWLDQGMAFPAIGSTGVAWSRAEWVENTFGVWRQMVGPIVSSISAALTKVVGDSAAADPTFAGMQSMIQPMLRAAASGMFGSQVGQALGKLATEVVSVADSGLPMTKSPVVAILPVNVAAFAQGLGVPESDVLLYLALRETARQRLFAHVAWLGPQLLALVEHYAREISIDAAALEEAMESRLTGDVGPEDFEGLGQELAGRLFEPAKTPEQVEILGRLETLLALVEGWVDDAVAQAAAPMMPSATTLAEVVRRRRASGGPAETALKSLVGLELRPRRMRDAANLWAAVRSARGAEARDALWHHPDYIPTAADLDDPIGFVERPTGGSNDDLDAELAKLLDDRGQSDPPAAPGH